VLAAREQYFKLLSPSGVLKPSTAPVDGIFNAEKDKLDYPGIGAGHADEKGDDSNADLSAKFMELALKAHTEPWYKDVFCQNPALLDWVAKVTGWGKDTWAVRRSLLRNNTPGNKAIGVHYDQIFLRHGEDSSLTAWVPMGDVKLNGGGLIYLEGGECLANLKPQIISRQS
jgi:phytanoyl-CoA hydroxylase